METHRVHRRVCILLLCLTMAATFIPRCDARRSMGLIKKDLRSMIKTTKKLKVMKHMDGDPSYNTGPYGVNSPFTLPPFDSLSPFPQPENAPPFCIYPPSTSTPNNPPVFQPPIVYPPPTGPPAPRTGPRIALWCVAKPTVPDPIIQEAMNYACGSGADCDTIQVSGPCFHPNSVYAHASFAFNSYWQRTKVAGGRCSFGGTAMLVTVDPSHDGCQYIYY